MEINNVNILKCASFQYENQEINPKYGTSQSDNTNVDSKTRSVVKYVINNIMST